MFLGSGGWGFPPRVNSGGIGISIGTCSKNRRQTHDKDKSKLETVCTPDEFVRRLGTSDEETLSVFGGLSPGPRTKEKASLCDGGDGLSDSLARTDGRFRRCW